MSHQVTAQEHYAQDHHAPHVVSLGLLSGVFGALLFFTLLTVGVTAFDFGYSMNLTVAMVIAMVKGLLVGLYFMHLRWDAPLNSFILIAALLFVTLFITLLMADTDAYAPAQREAALARPAAANP